MILFKRRYCRKHGHDIDPDPGDFVMFCRRCHAMADLHEILDALQAAEAERPMVPVKEVTYTARHWGPAIEHAHYLRDFAAIAELDLHGIHADHCGGYETLAWPCPTAAEVLERLLCHECVRPRPCPIHDWRDVCHHSRRDADGSPVECGNSNPCEEHS